MKYCPVCNTEYANEQAKCIKDGSLLAKVPDPRPEKSLSELKGLKLLKVSPPADEDSEDWGANALKTEAEHTTREEADRITRAANEARSRLDELISANLTPGPKARSAQYPERTPQYVTPGAPYPDPVVRRSVAAAQYPERATYYAGATAHRAEEIQESRALQPPTPPPSPAPVPSPNANANSYTNLLLFVESVVLAAVIATAAWIYWEYRQNISSRQSEEASAAINSTGKSGSRSGRNGSSPGNGTPTAVNSSTDPMGSGVVASGTAAGTTANPADTSIGQAAKIEDWETGNLDKFAERLQKEPASKAVVVGFLYPMEKGGDQLARLRAVNAKAYLTDVKGIAPSRVQAVTGVGGGNADVVLHGKELYRVPANASVNPPVGSSFDEAALKKSTDASPTVQPPSRPATPINTPTGAWKDPATWILWSMQDNGSDVDWKQAMDYCANLRLDGVSGWALPSIDELAGLYDPKQEGGSRHIKGGIKLSECCVWSRDVQAQAAGKAFYFIFSDGRRAFDLDGIKFHKRAVCVRGSAE
jgi:hypothetical protein